MIESRKVWTFPEGACGHDESVKGYTVAYSPDMVDQFARGALGGGFVWPYTDV